MWHFCKASGARKVERVQEQALRIVYNTFSSILQSLQVFATLKMYKVKYGLLTSKIIAIFSVKPSKYHLRNRDFYLSIYIRQQNQGQSYPTIYGLLCSFRGEYI